MNRGIFIFLGAIAAIGFAGLYLLQHGSALFASGPPTDRIVFISTRAGHPDIWTMKGDGSDEKQITDDPAEDTAPAWSPSGVEIASVSNREDERFELYVSAWTGRYLKRLTIGAGTKDCPVWSPDGKEIAFLSSGTVHVLSRYGGDDLQIMPTVEQGVTQMTRPYTNLVWSPKGRTLAAVENWDSRQYAVVREEFDNPDRAPLPPVTSAANVRVAWAKHDYRAGVSFIDRIADDGKRTNGILVFDPGDMTFEDALITDSLDSGPGALAWSPDGSRIAFEMWSVADRRPDKCIGLYVIDTEGGKPKLVAQGEAMDPTWSPDGRYLAYTLPREDGKRDIWRVGADGKGAVNLTNGEGDNSQPEWSPAPKKR